MFVDILIKDQSEFDLLRYFIEGTFSIVVQVRRRVDWVKDHSKKRYIVKVLRTYLKVLSRTSGIIRASNGQEISKQGLVLTSIK